MTAPERDAPIVEIATGKLRGEQRADVQAYYAVPYAAPPVGALRFAAPQPATPWPGVRDASRRGPSAPQGPSRLDAVMGVSPFEQSEDCLHVAVWTPAQNGASPAGRRPVMVWLHGGAYQSGGGNQVFYDGGNLAAHGDAVVVSVNYRLGALGYLYVPGAEAPANRGLLDQIAALRWVRDNIAAFGGDPDNVTVFGQSAGGGSAFALLSVPEARALFHKAILQSAPAIMLTPEKARAYSTRFHELAGVSPSDVAALRALPATDIVALQRKLQMEIATTDARSIAYQMVRGLAPLDIPAGNVLASGDVRHIPVLIGSTLDEGHAWMAQDEALRAQDNWDAVLPIARAAFNEDGSGLPAGRLTATSRPWERLSAILTWVTFEKTVLNYAQAHMSSGGAAWAYRFDWRPTPDARYGACHCIEIPFMFDNLDMWPQAAMVEGHKPESFQRLARTMRDAWIAFARTGNPQTPALPDWPRWNADKQTIMLFDDTISLSAAPAL